MTAFKNPIVFINYRRDDSKAEARSLSNDLENKFGEGFVFRDQDDLRAGEVWSEKLVEAGNNAKAIVAVIGPDWLQLNDEGKSRLWDTNDWVRKELELAIKAKKLIIPALVKGAKPPKKSDIPPSLHSLYGHQFFILRDDKWNVDIPDLVKDISFVTGIKTLAEQAKEKEDQNKKAQEKSSRKKIFMLTIGLFASAAILLAYVYFSSGIEKKQGAKEFCPQFEKNAAITTLLYPFGEVNASESRYELKVQDQISDICTNLNIFNDVKLPNIDNTQHYNQNQAKNKCKTCNSDIFITGLSGKTSNGKANIKANIGFCDSKYAGYALDKEKLEIVASFSDADVFNVDANISQSLEYAFEIFLGIHQIKSGNIEEGVQIILKAIKKYPKSKDLEIMALDVLWQAQYKLGRKKPAASTLEAMYILDNRNTLPLKLKADIYFQEKQYDKAIEDLDIIIDKEANKTNKEKFLERRGDSYFESKQYDKAKKDYENIPTNKVKAKLKATNQIIKANDNRINNFGAVATLSTSDKTQLINLHVQNGNISKASQILNTIDPTAYKTPEQMKAIGIKVSTFKVLQKSNQDLPPAVKYNFNKIENAQLHNVSIENH